MVLFTIDPPSALRIRQLAEKAAHSPIMRYTIIIKKVIREVIGLFTIVLFIYTCTKIRTSAGHKKAAARDTTKTSKHTVTNTAMKGARNQASRVAVK